MSAANACGKEMENKNNAQRWKLPKFEISNANFRYY